MHSFIVLSLAILTCSAAILLAHATKPFLLFFDGLTVRSLLRRALPATVELCGRLYRRPGGSDLASKISHWLNLASRLNCNRAPPAEEPSKQEPSSIQDLLVESPSYGWLWLKVRRVFVKAFLNVLRRRIGTLSLPSWSLRLSFRPKRVTSSSVMTTIFAACSSHCLSPTSMLTVAATGMRHNWTTCCISPEPEHPPFGLIRTRTRAQGGVHVLSLRLRHRVHPDIQRRVSRVESDRGLVGG